MRILGLKPTCQALMREQAREASLEWRGGASCHDSAVWVPGNRNRTEGLSALPTANAIGGGLAPTRHAVKEPSTRHLPPSRQRILVDIVGT